LLQGASKAFYANTKIQTWYGLRILAVDGSKFTLPKSPIMSQTFGGQRNQWGDVKPMALVSCLYDVYQGLVLDAKLTHYNGNEGDLALQHLEQTDTSDLILYDRGYPSFWLVMAHFFYKRHFCMRIRSNFNKQTQAFSQSKNRDTVITLVPRENMQDKARQRGLPVEPVKVRLLKVKTSKGIYLLMTSLTDHKQYPAKDFHGLYHLRWQIEEGYKKQKSFFEIENFSGKSELSIQQDFHACMLRQTLTAISCFYSQGFIHKRVRQRKYAYKVSFAKAIPLLRGSFLDLLSGHLSLLHIRQWLQTISQNLSAIRPGRSFERVKVQCRRQMLRNGYRYC